MSPERGDVVGRAALTGLVAGITLLLSGLVTINAQGVPPANDAFHDTWARTDEPVASGAAARTWLWGPDAFTPAMIEPYDGAPGGERTVQYFDKSRMEITNPDADPASPWYVTNGLLVVEMISGRVQLGDETYEQREPAGVNVAGDPQDKDAPTYATLGTLTDLPARPEGQTITGVVTRDGTTTSDDNLEEYGVTSAHLVPETNHAVASVFWEFMRATGTVLEDGQYVDDALFENPFFATGFPVTEAYWATVEVGGTPTLVLIQAFERRVLTYTPNNPEGWRVESGNAGRHYHAWRYGTETPNPDPVTEPEPTATPQPASHTIDVSGLEIAPGTTTGDTTYGLTFVGTASGDISGAMQVTLDYTPPDPDPNVTNTIVGGEWSIESETGTISGLIESGSAVWDADVSRAVVNASFKVTEASGDLASLRGSGTFDGALSHTQFPPRIGGRLALDLEPAEG